MVLIKLGSNSIAHLSKDLFFFSSGLSFPAGDFSVPFGGPQPKNPLPFVVSGFSRRIFELGLRQTNVVLKFLEFIVTKLSSKAVRP